MTEHITETKPEEIKQSVVVENGGGGNFAVPLSILIGCLIIAGSVVYTGRKIVGQLAGGSITTTNNNQGGNQPTAVQGPKIKFELKSDTPFLGQGNAKVTVVEFADYQCPFCERWYKDAYPQLKSQFIDTGKVKFVYQDFAFLGADSQTAAEAAHCAAEQGKFWQYHDYLFSNQGQENSGWATADKQKTFAKTLGLNTSQFNSCLDSKKLAQKVQDETNLGKSFNVSGTPTTLVFKNSDPTFDTGVILTALQQRQNVVKLPNGNTFIVGAQPMSVFQTAIDDASK